MKTQTEKYRDIITTAYSSLDSYKPSYHMLRLYKDLGMIHDGRQRSIELMRTFVTKSYEVLETTELIDWDESKPVLLYYLDDTSVEDIFSYLESRIVDTNRRMMFMAEMYKDVINNGNTPGM